MFFQGLVMIAVLQLFKQPPGLPPKKKYVVGNQKQKMYFKPYFCFGGLYIMINDYIVQYLAAFLTNNTHKGST